MNKFNGKMKCDDCCKDLPSPLHAMVTSKRPGTFCQECVQKPVDEDPTDEPFRMLDVVRAPKTGILYVVDCNASLRNVNEPWSGYELAYRANDDAVEAFTERSGIEFIKRIKRVKPDAWFCADGCLVAYTADFKRFISAEDRRWIESQNKEGWFKDYVQDGAVHPECAKRWLEMHKVNVKVVNTDRITIGGPPIRPETLSITWHGAEIKVAVHAGESPRQIAEAVCAAVEVRGLPSIRDHIWLPNGKLVSDKNEFRKLMDELGGAGLHAHAAHYYGLLPNVPMDTGWSEAVDRELRTRMAERWSDPCFASRPSCECGSVIRNCAHTNWVCKCGSLSYVADYMSDEQKETARRHGREEYEFTLRCGGPYTVAGCVKNAPLISWGATTEPRSPGATSGTMRMRNGKYEFGPVKPAEPVEYVLPKDFSDYRPETPAERLAGEMVKIGGITFEQALVFAEMKIAQEKIDRPMHYGPDPYKEHREKLADDSSIGWNDDRTGEDDEMVALETDLKQYGSSKPKFILDQIPEPKVKPSKPHPWECDESDP